jgi:hypothetical protein
MSATAKGRDMTMRTFRAALKCARETDEGIFLGGGEPTMHPKFIEMLCLAIAHCHSEVGVNLVTNGTNKEACRLMTKLAGAGVITAELSIDPFHDAIDPEVEGWFEKNNAIRTVRTIMARGRGRHIAGSVDKCACDELFVSPDGKLWMCGCRTVSFGTVAKPEIPSCYWDMDERCGENERFKQYTDELSKSKI